MLARPITITTTASPVKTQPMTQFASDFDITGRVTSEGMPYSAYSSESSSRTTPDP